MVLRNFLSTKSISSTSGSFAMLLIRVVFGGLMLLHGMPKILNFSAISANFDPIGLGGTLSLSLVIFAEVFCSIAIMLGFLTRLASLPLIINMSVAVFAVHAGQPLVAMNGPSMEVPLIYLTIFVAILFAGPGKFSVDKFSFN